MTQFLNKLHYLVSGQLPEFVRDEYPVFTAFIEAYYRFLEERTSAFTHEGWPGEQVNAVLLNTETWSDIDLTLDAFIPAFRSQFAWDIPHNTLVDIKRLIKFIDQYYEAKGSENATKLFFRFMFNDDASISYPGDYLLRASDGRWTQRHILKLDTTHFIDETDPESPFVYDLENRIITISYTVYKSGVGNVEYTTTTAVLGVVKVAFVSGSHIYKLIVDLDPRYQFPIEAIPTDPIDISREAYNSHIYVSLNGIVYGTLTKQLVSVNSIEEGGSEFRIGDSFVINESGVTGAYFQEGYTEFLVGPNAYVEHGVGINNAIVRVKKITKDPNREYFFENYVEDDYVVVPLNNQLLRLGIVTSGHQFNVRKDVGPYGYHGYVESGYWEARTIVPETEFVATIYPYEGGEPSTTIFNTGYLFLEGGRFDTNAGLLSDINRIQDNYYYQPYSYVIKTHQQLLTWEKVFKGSAHPAGFEVFSSLQIEMDDSLEMIIGGDITQGPTPTTTTTPPTTAAPTTTTTP